MNRFLFLLLPLGACGDKTPPATPATAAAEAEPSLGDIPGDATSEKFATALMKSNGGGLRLSDSHRYTSLTFGGDNTWKAAGYVEAMDEKMECTETGTWKMDPAESASVASMTWTVAKTDCIGREPGEHRVKVTIAADGKLDVEFR